MLNQADTKRNALILEAMLNQGDSTMKLKPEYRKLLEIYPDLEDKIKEKPSDYRGFVTVFNMVTEYCDRVWIA